MYKELIPLNLEDLIRHVEDRSDALMQRVRVTFTNGYALSVIQGDGAYGVKEAPFEIAPINLDDKLDSDLFDGDDQCDAVLGCCDIATVNHYMTKLANLPGDTA